MNPPASRKKQKRPIRIGVWLIILSLGIWCGYMGWIREIPDGWRVTRVWSDVMNLQSSTPDPNIHLRDAWGNEYRIAIITEQEKTRRKVYSLGPDGVSLTLGDDRDDISESTQNGVWVENRFHVSRWRWGFLGVCVLFFWVNRWFSHDKRNPPKVAHEGPPP